MTEGSSRSTRRAVLACGAAALALSACGSNGKPDPTLETSAKAELQDLLSKNSAAQAINSRALAVLVFPRVTRGALVFGGQTGKGVLFRQGQQQGYYRFSGLTWGLSAGVQAYSYALFFMNQKALDDLQDASGWEFGVGPTVVVVDEGKAAQLTTTTANDDIYAFVWGQEGLMAGVDLQGSKITKLD